MKIYVVYLGIDVSKRTLHLASAEQFIRCFDNSKAGHQLLIQALKEFQGCRVVLEASGGYERPVCEALQEAGIEVAVAQPSCIRHFAKSMKVLAKTDEIDARIIAQFGEAIKPEPTPKTPENTRKLRALSDRRQQVVEDRVRETCRLEACASPAVAELIRTSIEQLKSAEKELNQQIETLIKTDSELAEKARIMLAVVGVGQKTANVLLAHFPELGSLSRGEVAALAGVAPHAQESGSWKGKRRIYGGRAAVRKAIYMAAKTAARCCPVIREFYQRLKEKGKAYNVSLIACARKMLIHLNTLLKPITNNNSSTIAPIAD